MQLEVNYWDFARTITVFKTGNEFIIFSVGAMAMNDRRGHGRMRLTSRKHFRPKPKRPRKSSTISDSESVPAILPSLCILLPSSAYTNAPLLSMDIYITDRRGVKAYHQVTKVILSMLYY